TIEEVLQHYDALTVRFFLLGAHYRHPLDFSDSNLKDSQSAVGRLMDGLQTLKKVLELLGLAPLPYQRDEVEKDEAVREFRARFEEAMDDDLNTARALGILFEILTDLHERRQALQQEQDNTATQTFLRLLGYLEHLLDLFGLVPVEAAKKKGVKSEAEAENLINLLISLRNLARESKEFAIADRIRDGLAKLGIKIEDHPQGTIWKR
ncbi:MAG: DALR domain-containing protein, partial [bacterium]